MSCNISDIVADETLFQEIQRGDEKAFDVLFLKYYPSLCAYAQRFVEYDDGQEIVQDVMVWLWGIGITGGTGRGAPGGSAADRGQEGGHVGEIHGGVVDGGADGVRGTLGIGDTKDQTGHQGQQHGDRQHQRHKGVSLHMPQFFHVPHLLNPALASPAPPER